EIQVSEIFDDYNGLSAPRFLEDRLRGHDEL
ncbi:MAG: hypothetical protein H6Q43_2882, partial [Deltaproteobacteria bacterium]|nr:hypothetical protein [Deltaproteobacteria bacterium]